MIKLYKQACEKNGIPVNKEKLLDGRAERVTKSAKVEIANREKDHNVVLPPIDHPSMHPAEKPRGTQLEEIYKTLSTELFRESLKKGPQIAYYIGNWLQNVENVSF